MEEAPFMIALGNPETGVQRGTKYLPGILE